MAVLVMSSCAAPVPLRALVAEARRNEIAAHRLAAGREVAVTGDVLDITFLRTERQVRVNEWRIEEGPAPSSALPRNTSAGRATSEVRTERSERPYLELRASDGTRVFCFVHPSADVDALSVGQPGAVAGVFMELQRGATGQYVVTLTDCRVLR